MKDIIEYIRSDYHRYYGGGYETPFHRILMTALIARNHCFTYNFYLRLSQRKNPFYLLARIKLRRMQVKYGIQIPAGTKIGYGFYIGHGIGIVIHPNTVIGNNVNISQFLTIGSNKSTPATIGDNVYIGPNVCIVEDVKIGNDVTIGAGSVVAKDILSGATAAGVPAKVISYNKHDFVQNKYLNKTL